MTPLVADFGMQYNEEVRTEAALVGREDETAELHRFLTEPGAPPW